MCVKNKLKKVGKKFRIVKGRFLTRHRLGEATIFMYI